jgi:hypothetical protein
MDLSPFLRPWFGMAVSDLAVLRKGDSDFWWNRTLNEEREKDVISMNESSDRMKSWLAGADQKRAEVCLAWLRGHLAIGLFDGAAPLHYSIEGNADTYLRLLSESPCMCKAIERAAGGIRRAMEAGHYPDDIRLVQNVAAMLGILRLGGTEAGASVDILDAIDSAHEGAVRQMLSLATDQIDGLCHFILDVRSFLGSLATGSDSRILLIEMPSGNSVPVKILAPLLGQEPRVQIVRAALSRKHPKAAGITRRQLLDEQLQHAKLRPNDVLVYLDEWETGSNFNTICDFLRKIIPKGAFLFPAAFQTDAAAQHERYSSFRADHDTLLKVWGVPGERFRRLLPPLPSTLGGGYFFWSEHDRTAGYRKMQLHGSVFSSIDEAVETLHKDEKACRASVQILLGELASQVELPGTPGQGVNATQELFVKSYEDYLQCRDELRRCADDYVKGGEIVDFDSAMEPIMRRYDAILGERKAKLAVCMAASYIGRVASLDPANRYHFDDHAPVLMELDGPSAATHRIVMEVLRRRLDDLEHATAVALP